MQCVMARRCESNKNRERRQQTEAADAQHSAPPRHEQKQQCHNCRKNHLTKIAGEIIRADRLARGGAPISFGNQIGGDRMLCRQAEAEHGKRDDQREKPIAEACEQISARGKRGAHGQHRAIAEAAGKLPRRHLEQSHAAGIDRAQQTRLRIGERKFRLEQWQEHVHEIGETVMQRMRGISDIGWALGLRHALYPNFLRASAAPAPSACSFATAMSRRIGAMPQFVEAMIFSLATYFIAWPMTAATSSGVSMLSLATSMTPTCTSLPSSSFINSAGTRELRHSSET